MTEPLLFPVAPARDALGASRAAIRAWCELFKHSLKQRLEYRGSFVFSLVLHPLVMVLVLVMFRTVYAHRAEPTLVGYSLSQMVWYFGAGQFFYYLVWNVVDQDMGERVRYGRMDQVLVRPYSLFTWELVQLAAHKLLALGLEFLPVFSLYTLISRPEFLSAPGLARYGLLTGLAALQFFAMSFVLGVLALSWQNVSAFTTVKTVAVSLLAGVALPLAFFPPALREVVLALPFHYLFHTPVAYLLGTAPDPTAGALLRTVAGQLAWTAAFIALGLLLYRRTLRRFLSVGG